MHTIGADQTVLATGGAGKVYLYTTNPDTRDRRRHRHGLARRLPVANMEFIQFHPTCLYHPHAKSFLITEAVRGEGGLLRLPDGTRFMPAHDQRAELAPRDVVARAIDFEMKKRGLDCVYLDITHKPANSCASTFRPSMRAAWNSASTSRASPSRWCRPRTTPAAASQTDRSGRTRCAVGSTPWAKPRMHRPARRQPPGQQFPAGMPGVRPGGRRATSSPQPRPAAPGLPQWDESRVTDADEEVVISHNWDEMRRFMWDYVGIVRTNKRLERAQHRIACWQAEIQEYYSHFRVTGDLLELRNLVTTAELIVALRHARGTKAAGLHFSRDYPGLLAEARDTVLKSG